MDMKWNLDALYTSFESDNFLGDIKELDTNTEELNIWAEKSLITSAAVQDNPAEIGNIIRKYLDSYINIRKLYSALSSYAELTFSVDASNHTAKKYTEILQT